MSWVHICVRRPVVWSRFRAGVLDRILGNVVSSGLFGSVVGFVAVEFARVAFPIHRGVLRSGPVGSGRALVSQSVIPFASGPV